MQAAAWGAAIARLILGYDDLLALVWQEHVSLRLLREVGYRVRFEHREVDRSAVGWDKVPHEIMSLRRWYDWE